MKTVQLFLTLLATLSASTTQADTFGSGSNTFEIEFIHIGNPGNDADTTGAPNPAGSVAYEYRIGKYEISEQMVDKANALSSAEGQPLGITKDTRGPDRPATSVTWFEAAKFANWLNTSTGNSPAYKFDGNGDYQLWQAGDAGYDPSNVFRSSLAKYFLPSLDEWFKAAYYDPFNEVYYRYPTGSDDAPNGINFEGDTEFDAAFYDGIGFPSPSPFDITDVGVLSP